MSLATLPAPVGDPLRVFVVGMSGSGKTTLIKSSIPDWPRLIIWDWKGEYSGEVVSIRRLAELLAQPGPFLARYRPKRTGSMVKQFEALSTFLLFFPRAQNATFIIDEAHMVAQQDSMDSEGLSGLLRLSRSQNLTLVYTSQRPTYVPGSLLSECHWLVVFHLHRPSDLLAVRPYMQEDEWLLVPRLPKFEYIPSPLVLF